MFCMAMVLLPTVCADTKKPAPEPRVSSVHPLTGQAGSSYAAIVRGNALKDAHALTFSTNNISARVLRAEAETATEADAKAKPELLHVEVSIGAATQAGNHSFRVLSPEGVSNEISLRVVAEPVVQESKLTGALERFPAVVSGRIDRRGETDAYWIQATAGQTLTFEAYSGHASFDPALSLYEQSGSWFDPQRLNKIAFNDEPLFFPGLSTNARLAYTFEKPGRYSLKVQAFSGQGGPDFVYELRVTPGIADPPALHPKQTGWEERQFTRRLASDWLQQLSRRGGIAVVQKRPETYRAVLEGSASAAPVMTAPGLVEGRLTSPAEAHVIKLKVDQPQSLVIEIETPEATMPRFNPVIRLMEPGGTEIATNVYTKLNNNGLYMMKMIQAKTAVPLRAAGEYTLQIRDIITDRAGQDFAYRVLVRPRIPHIGRIIVAEETVNLQPGVTKPLTVSIEREEDFAGHVALHASGLPAGVTAVTGVPNPVEKPPLPNGGKLERYTPKTQNAALLLVAAPDAPVTPAPVTIEITARPMVDGELGEPIVVKKIPVMVLTRRPS